MTKKAKTGSRRRLSAKQKIAQLPIPDRISTAKRIVDRVIDHLIYVLELLENNAIVLYPADAVFTDPDFSRRQCVHRLPQRKES
jgi:hypothetical protein